MFKRYWWMLLVMMPVGMLCGFLLAALVNYMMPKEYESFATIEVRPQQTMDPGQPSSMVPMYLATEFNKITSRSSLTKVIESLDLTTRWDMHQESVLRILKEIVQTQNIRGTDLISITVRHTNREDARDITAEVARAYKEYRSELESKVTDNRLNELKKALREQEDKVEERRKVLDTIMRTKELPFRDTSPPDASEATKAGSVVTNAKLDFETDQALLEQMKLKLISTEIETKVPVETIVIHDDPVIADSPVSPNVTLNLVIGAVGGLLLSPFLALPLMWILSRKRAEV